MIDTRRLIQDLTDIYSEYGSDELHLFNEVLLLALGRQIFVTNTPQAKELTRGQKAAQTRKLNKEQKLRDVAAADIQAIIGEPQ